ncbi:MAG: serine--tRNA ligase, partial [Methanosarcinales archaeon]
MEFYLKGCFKTSANTEDAFLDLKEFFEKANKTILTKGAPHGMGAKIKTYYCKDNQIILEIESTRYVRAHDAI